MKRITAWLLCLLLLMGLALSGCKQELNSEQETQVQLQPEREYGSLGEMSGVQYDEKYGNLISPYTRCQISLGEGSSAFSMLDGVGNELRSSYEQLTTAFTENTAEAVQSWEDGSQLTTQFSSNEDGTLNVTQSLTGANKGVSALRFALTVPMKYNVIIPAWSGICLSAEQPEIYNKATYLPYPREWCAQMFLIQGTNGGILVYAKDDGTQFKSLNVTNDGENFTLELGSIPQAPFTDYTGFESIQWCVVPYEGGWMQGALLYKQIANDTFKLSELNELRPAWVDDIGLVWMDDLDSKEKLQELAKEVDPAKTLIQIPGWRVAAYDTEYPDYAPKADTVEMIAYAHSLGFRVSLHCNMIGCSFSSQEWQDGLSEAASLDAYSQETIVEGYTAFGKDYRFGQINQASTQWQDLMVERMTKLVEETGADCIHLDQSLLCFNDGRGYVNGMTSMQGNVELQRRLAEALPGVAFSGEGENEFNMRYADFLQQHVYGLDSNSDIWSDDAFEQICPIVNVIFGDYCKLYHYPALPTADEENEAQLLAWYRAGNQRVGHIPCLYRESYTSITEQSDAMKFLLDDARFYMDKQPRLNTGEWGDKAIMSYVLNDGTIAEWVQTDEGTSFYPNCDTDEVTMCFVHGTSELKTDRTIRNWLVYDENKLKGLLENETYLLLNEPRSNDDTHITELEDNLTTRAFLSNDRYTAVAMQELVASNKRVVDLMNFDGEFRCGEVLYNGDADDAEVFNSTRSFWYTLKDQGQVRHLGDRILFHPPWHDEVEAIGYTWMELDVPLEVLGNAAFNASFQLATAESAAGSDGVIFKVYAWAKDDTARSKQVTQEVVCLTEVGILVSLDLTQFEGKTVTIRIECYTGETPRYDSSHMVSPQLVQNKGKVDRTVSYTLHTAKDIQGILSMSGTAKCEPLGDGNYTITSPIDDTLWLLHNPEIISKTEDLTEYPFTSAWVLDTGESSAPTKDMLPRQQVGEAYYELKNGIYEHPPQGGEAQLSYLLTLPDGTKSAFTAYPVLKTGAIQSDGVTFRVLVNGKEVFQIEKMGGGKFEQIRVDLSQWAGQSIVLTLCTNSGETSAYDYAFWGDPLLESE